jgi:hypothetical protein
MASPASKPTARREALREAEAGAGIAGVEEDDDEASCL